MMSSIDIDKVLDKIQKLESVLEYADNNFYLLNQEYKNEISKFPFNEILNKNGIIIPEDSNDIKNSVIDLYKEDKHQKFDKIINELKQYPEYQKSTEILHKRDIARIEYYIALYNYLNYIDQVRKLLFSNTYNENIDYLADAGYLLYHYHIPDFVIEQTSQDKLEEYISNIYSKNNYEIFDYSFHVIFEMKKYFPYFYKIQYYHLNYFSFQYYFLDYLYSVY